MSEVKIESVFTDLSEMQLDFVDIIIDIIKQKYESLKETNPNSVSLDAITLTPSDFTDYYVGHMQDIALKKGKGDQSPSKTASNMLAGLCKIDYLVRYRKGIYRLKRDSCLYKHLDELIDI